MPRRQCPRHRCPGLPPVWLFTDERIGCGQMLASIVRLPRGSGVIFRHYRTPPAERRMLFAMVRKIARRRGLVLLLAGSDAQAARWRADGAHGRAHDRIARRPDFLRSAPVHDRRELVAAHAGGADIAFLSPLFATRSHPGATPLGPVRFAALARTAPMAIFALGGVRPSHERMITMLGASGYGAIDALCIMTA